MTFVPQIQFINAITLGLVTIVSFIAPHDYIAGEIVSFRISPQYGTVQLNNQDGLILSTTSTTITVNIDSTFYNPFIYPVGGLNTPPICVPSGSGITLGSNPATVTLQCPFDNVPPN